MDLDRSWMYRRTEDGYLNPKYVEGVDNFIKFGTSNKKCMDGEKIRCPCTLVKCRNRRFLDIDIVKYHLVKHGFVRDYLIWVCHGETKLPANINRDAYIPEPPFVGGSSNTASEQSPDACTRMIHDAAGPEFDMDVNVEEPPNPEAQKFYDMLKAAYGRGG